jgi:hypothetical protein
MLTKPLTPMSSDTITDMEMTTVSAGHLRSPGPYECPDSTCGQDFADLDAFYKHWTQHRKQCPFPSCATRIDSKYNFGRHWARKHADHFTSHQSFEKTACKQHCGKLYSKANVSNLRRHEKTCRANRDQIRPPDSAIKVISADGDATSATDRDTHHVDAPNPLHDIDEYSRDSSSQDVPSPDQPSFVFLHSPDKRISSAGCWRESKPIVEAIETLQRLLAGGPAADALQAFTVFLDNLGPSIHVSTVSSSGGLYGAAGQSDGILGLDDVQQRGRQSGVQSSVSDHEITVTDQPTTSKRGINTEDVDFSHASSKKRRSVEYHELDQEIEDENLDIMLDVTIDVRIAYKCIWPSTLTVVKILKTFWTHEKRPTSHPHKDLDLSDVQAVENVTNFCEWFATVLVSLDLYLQPNIISLALLIVYRLKIGSCFKCKRGDGYHVVGIALMLAESFCEVKPHTAVYWAEVTGIPVARMIIMERRTSEDLDVYIESEMDWGTDKSGFVDSVNKSFALQPEFRDAPRQSLLPRIRGWHRLAPYRSGWESWN